MKKNSFIEGTIFAYISILLTKIIGAVYVIPFYKIIGTSGGVLYSYAYNVYNLFLNISTSGIPTAVSIIIAEYNALKMFNEREKAFKVANKVIAFISFIAFLIMFTFAGVIGIFFVGDLKNSTSIESIKLVIRTISFCLLIIPFLSVTRGYLQGNKYIVNSSFSQLIEQIVRIFVVLVGSFIAINVLHFSIPFGVSVALFGTVLGGLAALLYLKFKIHKNKDEFNKGVTNINDAKVTNKEIIRKIIVHAVPIIIISVTQNIYEMTDMKLIIKGLYMIGYDAQKCELLASIIVTWAPKICMIINAIAIGLCTSIIPYIVSSHVNNETEKLNKKFNQAINTIIFVGIPLSIYIIVFSKQVYSVFYGNSVYGGVILATLSVVSITFSIQLITNMMLQGMKKYKIVYINTIVGIIVNTLLDVPIILLLHKIGLPPYLGSLIATIIGQGVAFGIVLFSLKKDYSFKYKEILNVLSNTLISVSVMLIPLIIFRKFVFKDLNYILNIIELGIFGLIGISIYIFITYKNGFLNSILGEDFVNKILIKLKLKKLGD